jgi:hypothetical protein
MISVWQNEVSLVRSTGENWSLAVIPNGMERFVRECWVHHYYSWNQVEEGVEKAAELITAVQAGTRKHRKNWPRTFAAVTKRGS